MSASKGTRLDTAPLDGLRAVYNLWVMAFHSFCWMMPHMTDAESLALGSAPLLAPVMHGLLAVDGFFVLTGFLLAYQRLRGGGGGGGGGTVVAAPAPAPVAPGETAAAGGAPRPAWWRALGDAYLGRFARILPPYIAVAVLHCVVFFPGGFYPMPWLHRETWQANLLRGPPAREVLPDAFPSSCEVLYLNVPFLNMLIPYGGCMIHVWSLGVQMQFYLLFPLLWGLSGWLDRGKRLAGAVSLVTIVAVVARVFGRLQVSWFPVGTVVGEALYFFWYANTFTRIYAMFLGAAVAHIAVRTEVHQWFASARGRVASGALNAAVVVLVAAAMSRNPPILPTAQRHSEELRDVVFDVLANCGGLLIVLAFCWTTYSAVRRVGVWRDRVDGGWGLAAALSGPRWSRAASLSYLMYLLHPAVYTILYAAPYLLAPPSSAAAAAAAASGAGPNPVDGPLHAAGVWAHGAVAAAVRAVPAAGRGAAAAAWAAVSMPTSATGISLGGFAAATLFAMGVTAVLAQVLYVTVEVPAAALLKRKALAAPARALALLYAAVLAAASLVGHAAVMWPVVAKVERGMLIDGVA